MVLYLDFIPIESLIYLDWDSWWIHSVISIRLTFAFKFNLFHLIITAYLDNISIELLFYLDWDTYVHLNPPLNFFVSSLILISILSRSSYAWFYLDWDRSFDVIHWYSFEHMRCGFLPVVSKRADPALTSTKPVVWLKDIYAQNIAYWPRYLKLPSGPQLVCISRSSEFKDFHI
jgi:hypothetical protein